MYESSVFINCPFDDNYTEILHAITFSICYANFIPRSALETTDSAQERLTKIVKIIKECNFSIHDISRVESVSSDPNNLPRFNMPFECGLFFGALHFGNRIHKTKKLLVLDSEKYRYQKTISDISGKDPACHENDPKKAIACVRRFLCDKSTIKTGHFPGEEFFQKKYKEFQDDLPSILTELSLTREEINKGSYWKDFVYTVRLWIKRRAVAP